MDTFLINPALEAAVVADADEDTPRLAYADWLDEHGDPDRAEFIRVQIAIANSTPADDAWFDLLVQEQKLAHKLDSRFVSIHSTLPSRFYFRTPYFPRSQGEEQVERGFPNFCDVLVDDWSYQQTEQFAEQLDQLVSTTTIRGVSFTSIPPARFAELVVTPAFAKLRQLAFSFGGGSTWQKDFEVIAYEKLLTAPGTQKLTRLSLGWGFPDYCVKALAEIESLQSLQSFSVRGAFPACPELSRVVRSEWFRRLRTVECSLNESESTEMVVDGLGKIPNLHSLKLNFQLSPEAITSLASAEFPRLVRLQTWDSKLKTSGLRQLLRANWFSRLRFLDLGITQLTDQAIAALAAHPVTRSLRELRTCFPFGIAGLMALARPDAFPELRVLDICYDSSKKPKATEEEMWVFLSALAIPNLKTLNLRNWPVGDSGAKAIAANSALAGLTELCLVECGLSDEGKLALENSPVRNAVFI